MTSMSERSALTGQYGTSTWGVATRAPSAAVTGCPPTVRTYRARVASPTKLTLVDPTTVLTAGAALAPT